MNSFKLFSAASQGEYSGVFILGRQLTIIALGLDEDQTVTFEVVQPSAPVFNDPCCPGPVQLPGVAAAVALKCCGSTIALTSARPYVILDAPIGGRIRARLNGGTNGVEVTAYESDTPNPTAYMRGCDCEA